MKLHIDRCINQVGVWDVYREKQKSRRKKWGKEGEKRERQKRKGIAHCPDFDGSVSLQP